MDAMNNIRWHWYFQFEHALVTQQIPILIIKQSKEKIYADSFRQIDWSGKYPNLKNTTTTSQRMITMLSKYERKKKNKFNYINSSDEFVMFI